MVWLRRNSAPLQQSHSPNMLRRRNFRSISFEVSACPTSATRANLQFASHILIMVVVRSLFAYGRHSKNPLKVITGSAGGKARSPGFTGCGENWRLTMQFSARAKVIATLSGSTDFRPLVFRVLPTGTKNATRASLEGVVTIYVVIEPDNGGEAVRTWLAKSKIACRAKLLTLDGFKDPSALYLDDPPRFPARLRQVMERAIPVSRALAEQTASEKAAAWAHCKHLASSVNGLERFEETLRARGVVGEERTAKLLYLALTSRFLERPVSVAIKGPSSGGKSFLTEQVLSFFPASAVYCLSHRPCTVA